MEMEHFFFFPRTGRKQKEKKTKVELVTSPGVKEFRMPPFVESRRSVSELRRKARRGTDCVSFFLQLNSPCFHSPAGAH